MCLPKAVLAYTTLLLGLAANLASAQINAPDFGIGARVFGLNNSCGDVEMCGASSGFDAVGIYDLEVYGPEYSDIDGFRFALVLPSTWEILSYETCGWTITNGDPFDPESGLELIAEECWWEVGPVLRVTVDCSTPGTVRMVARPDDDYVEIRDCGDDWRPVSGVYGSRVNIGDFCARLDPTGLCNGCSAKIAGTATPTSFDLAFPPGTVEVRSVRIGGDTSEGSCYRIPECGGDIHGSCFGNLQTPLPWLSIAFLGSEGDRSHEYELLFDSSGLPEGGYSGRVEITSGSCGDCEPSCIEVSMLTCQTPPCPGAGACCFDDGSCVFLVGALCDRQLGHYAGDSTVCDPTPCPPALACCFDDGTCLVLTESACARQRGASGQPGATCDPSPCEPGGACCRANGVCLILTEVRCSEQSGVWQAGIACTPYPCPPIQVAADGSGAVVTIQDGIEAITDGGVIELGNGVYTGIGNTALNFRGKAITLRSQVGDADSVTIDCEYNRGAILMSSQEGSDTRVEDITFIRGESSAGGGAYLYRADSVFERCRFLSCRAGEGGAIRSSVGRPSFIDCLFTGNQATHGGAISSRHGINLTGCTIAGNKAGSGGGIKLWSTVSFVSLERTVLWGNCDGTGPNDVYALPGSNPRFEAICSVVDSGVVDLDLFSGDLYFEDPAFCAPENCTSVPTTEFAAEVGSNSICLPSANDCNLQIGAGGIGCGDVAMGSCCLPAGTCQTLSEWSCDERAGLFSSNVSCDPNPCRPLEACCLDDVRCELLPIAFCLDVDGKHLPGVTECDPDICRDRALVVFPDGSGDFPNIQSAVDSAINGDVVRLVDGVFSGPGNVEVDLHGKAITLTSLSGSAADCIIDCRIDSITALPALWIASGGPDTRIERITFRHADATLGGAARIQNASPTFLGCVFDSCSARSGGALSFSGSRSQIEDCVFRDNEAEIGGAILALSSALRITSCVFESNSGSSQGGAYYGHGSLDGELTVFSRSTFYANSSPRGSALDFTGTGEFQIELCLLAFGNEGAAVTCESAASVTATCSDIYGHEGGDWSGCLAGQESQSQNFSLDPLFCDSTNADLSIDVGSPCAEAQSPCGELVGALPPGCSNPAGIESGPARAPTAIFLSSPRPNPTGTRTSLRFGLPQAELVELRIVDVSGRTVATPVRGPVGAGIHVVEWNGTTETGHEVPSGVYHVLLRVESVQLKQKLVWLRE